VGSVMLAKDVLGSLDGLDAVVIGRSNIVGKPVAQLLLAENCTVTIAHSKTKDLPGVVRRADLVIAAVGRPEMVKGDWLKPGATVIDVGINRIERDGKGKLVGDCDYASCEKVAGAITPVPGGVGPMTIACLLYNTVKAACAAKGITQPEM
jgi:methylenetetrahydrofolate dehydrogenase (NADP+)/methenyltetrahydrofolate cyclohydrolase